MENIHLKGFLVEYDDDPSFKGTHENVAHRIANAIKKHEKSKHEPDDDYKTHYSLYLPKVFVQIYSTKDETTLDEAKEMLILDTVGALDVYTEWYGYSEYTVEGFDVLNFTIGNHDLHSILKSHLNTYVHFVMSIIE